MISERRKVMVTVFWDSSGVILVDFFQRGRGKAATGMNSQYYAGILQEVRTSLPRVRRGKLARGVLLLQDNAPIHLTPMIMEFLTKNKFETVPHPPYSPDIAPSDYHLFPCLKNHLAGKKFTSLERLKEELRVYFESLPIEFYRRGIDKLKERMKMIIQLKGEHIQ